MLTGTFPRRQAVGRSAARVSLGEEIRCQSAGNARATAAIYERRGSGESLSRVFQRWRRASSREAPPTALLPSPGSGGRSTASEWNVPFFVSRSRFQGRPQLRSFQTTDTLGLSSLCRRIRFHPLQPPRTRKTRSLKSVSTSLSCSCAEMEGEGSS